MADTHRVEQSQWPQFFKTISGVVNTKETEIEVDALDIGAQIEVEWLPVKGLSFDSRTNKIELMTDKLTHSISGAKQVYAHYGSQGLDTIEVETDDDSKHIFKFRDPLRLPQ